MQSRQWRLGGGTDLWRCLDENPWKSLRQNSTKLIVKENSSDADAGVVSRVLG
jgi:hypothetical protein